MRFYAGPTSEGTGDAYCYECEDERAFTIYYYGSLAVASCDTCGYEFEYDEAL